MRLPDLARRALWCGIVVTAAGNRRRYAMTTTWLPHLAANTISLLLPDLLRLGACLNPAAGKTNDQRRTTNDERRMTEALVESANSRLRLLGDTLAAVVRDNPRYVYYVAPLAAGYLLSAPWLNIYKGRLGELRLAGFGLDALPHMSTAFAFTALTRETLRVAAILAPDDRPGRWLGRLDRRGALVAGGGLALLTLAWELGEYRIYRNELAQAGDAESINMQWSLPDMISDCAANAIGWLLAVAWPTNDE